MEWISVKNKLPKQDSVILCIDRNKRMFVATYCRNLAVYVPGYFDTWDSGHCCGNEPDDVTHWMPLPEMPHE